jgi:hypothetical protein
MWYVRGLYVLAVLVMGTVMIADGEMLIICAALLGLVLMEGAGVFYSAPNSNERTAVPDVAQPPLFPRMKTDSSWRFS